MNLQSLRDFMDKAVPGSGVSGIDCIIYHHHREIFRHTAGYGNLGEKAPLQPDALFNIYSATKVITCAAALQLIEKGLLDLNDPVSDYLPSYKQPMVITAGGEERPATTRMRILDLFTMTSGISYSLGSPHMQAFLARSAGEFDSLDFVNALAGQPLAFDPGEDWLYGFSHDVLGAVIEVATGLSLGACLRENIFDPLGMRDTGFTVPPAKQHRVAPQYDYNTDNGEITEIPKHCYGKFGTRQESGGSGLVSSCGDYILFADALACGGMGRNGNRILSRASLDLMRQNRLPDRHLASFHQMIPRLGNGYGLGVSVLENPAASGSLAPKGSFAWGGVGGVQNYFDPANRLSVFIAQHLRNSPKHLIEQKIRNILYAEVSNWNDHGPTGIPKDSNHA